MKTPAFCLALLSSISLFACGPHVLKTPEDGGVGWTQIETPHFTFITDVPAGRARAHALTFERQLRGLQRFIGREQALGERIRVVFLRSKYEISSIVPGLAGHYDTSAAHRPLLIAHEGGQGSLDIVTHELTHHVAYRFVRTQPAWYAEGLATYFENAELTPDETQLVVGKANRSFWDYLTNERPYSVREMVSEQVERKSARFYATAWLMMHYLMTERLNDVAAFERAIQADVEPQAAFVQAFGSDALSAFDETLRRYLVAAKFAYQGREVDMPKVDLRERTLSEGETRAVRALALLSALSTHEEAAQPDLRERARLDVEAALARNRADLIALALRAQYFPVAADAALRDAWRACAEQPEEGLAWVLLANELDRSGAPLHERERAVVHGLEKNPNEPALFCHAANIKAEDGKLESALSFAERAVQIAPLSRQARFAQSTLYYRLGRCADGARVQAFVEGLDEGWAAEDRTRLGALAQACAEGARRQ